MGHAPPQDLLETSVRLGRDRRLVQAAGGNTSAKEGDVLWIKASGRWLARAGADDFVPVSVAGVRRAVAAGDAESLQPQVIGDSPLRPSIETSLHALLPHRVVLHVHSVATLSWAIRVDGRERVEERLRGLPWAWVPYVRPGAPLAHAVSAILDDGHAPDVLVLGSHGLVVGAASCQAAEALLRQVEARLHVPERPTPGADDHLLAQAVGATGLALPADRSVHRLALDPVARAFTPRSYYPDDVVFLKARGMRAAGTAGLAEAVAAHQQRHGASPTYLVVDGVGVLARPDLDASAHEMLGCLTDVLLRVQPGAALRPLVPGEVAELLGWDAEKYRQGLTDAAHA